MYLIQIYFSFYCTYYILYSNITEDNPTLNIIIIKYKLTAVIYYQYGRTGFSLETQTKLI